MRKIIFLLFLFLLFSMQGVLAKDNIIFKKNLTNSISVISTEENTTLYFKNRVVSTVKNSIGELEYASLINDSANIKLLDPSIPFEKLTSVQKTRLGQLFAKNYFYTYIKNPLSDYRPLSSKNFTIIGEWIWEGPAVGWIINEKTGKIYKFTHGIQGIKQISEGKNGVYIMYDNPYEEPGSRMIVYTISGEKNIPLKSLPLSGDPEIKNSYNAILSYQYTGFDLLLNKKIRIWYGIGDDGPDKYGKEYWRKYILSL